MTPEEEHFRTWLQVCVGILQTCEEFLENEGAGVTYEDLICKKFEDLYRIVNGHPDTPQAIAVALYEMKKRIL